MVLLACALVAGGSASADELARAPAARWRVTRGHVEALADGRARVREPKMRAVVDASDGDAAELRFTYLGASDGEAFNASTMEVYSTQGNGTLTVVKEQSPTRFEVEQNLHTMNGARTLTFDRVTSHILTMSDEREPAPAPPPGGGRAARPPAVPGSFTILVIGKI